MTTKQSGTYFPAGVVEEFLPRIGRVVEIKDHQLAVFRASDGTIFAADNHTPTLRVGRWLKASCPGIICTIRCMIGKLT